LLRQLVQPRVLRLSLLKDGFCGPTGCRRWTGWRHEPARSLYIDRRGKRRCPFPRATIPKTNIQRSNETHQSKTDPDAKMARKGKGKEAKLSYNGNLLVENRHGMIVNSEVFEANGTAEPRCRAGDAGTDSGPETGNGGRRQGLRHGRFRGRMPQPQSHAARGSKSGATRWECD
jgi:hypothetical protein